MPTEGYNLPLTSLNAGPAHIDVMLAYEAQEGSTFQLNAPRD